MPPFWNSVQQNDGPTNYPFEKVLSPEVFNGREVGRKQKAKIRAIAF
jgi:hypothetical protein